jgi:peptide/nickel transport system substrate-binding protein
MTPFMPSGRLKKLVLLTGIVTSLAACASPAVGPQGPAAAPGASDAPKTLKVGFRQEFTTVYGGNAEEANLFNAGLTFNDHSGALLPQLAVKVPSLADGDWRTSPDNSMEVTWKLRPGLKWHDGAPLTAEDFAFTVRLFKDPSSAVAVPRAISFVSEVLVPDSETVVLRYPRIFNGAAVAGIAVFPPLPRHLLEEQFAQTGAAGVANHPVWLSEWTGLGPFKMTGRTLGSQIDAVAFDGFVFGRPRIDRLIIRFFPENDNHTLIANLMTGDVDIVPVGSLEPDDAHQLRQQWEAMGKGFVGVIPFRVKQMQIQFRDPTLPWAGDARVRQAMMHLIDRQAVVDRNFGIAPVADIVLPPGAPAYPLVERRGFLRHTLDLTHGERLLDATGWMRGPDGLRRNAAGIVFTFNPGNAGIDDVGDILILVDGWRAGGIRSEPNNVADAADNLNELRARADGFIRTAAGDDSYWDRFRAANIASPPRWSGANTGGYTNPTFDDLFAQWVVTLDLDTRLEREADMWKLLTDDVAAFPLYVDPEVFAFRRGVVGPRSGQGRNVTMDIHTWTIE